MSGLTVFMIGCGIVVFSVLVAKFFNSGLILDLDWTGQIYFTAGIGTVLSLIVYGISLLAHPPSPIEESLVAIEGSQVAIEGSIVAIVDEVVDGRTVYYLKLSEHPEKTFSGTSEAGAALLFAKPGDTVKLGVRSTESPSLVIASFTSE